MSHLLTCCPALIGLLLTLVAAFPTTDNTAKPTDGKPNAPRVLVLTGSPFQRGLTHGQTQKDLISDLIKRWKADLTKQYKLDADVFITKFVKATDYLSAIKKWTPELFDEIRGLSEGAGVDFNTMLVFQLTDEYWVNGQAIAREKCSSLGFSRRGDRPTIIAQNLDIECFWDNSQIILHIKPDNGQPEAFVLSHAGCIGMNGVNDRAVGICCNTLTQLRNCRDGLPVACVVRGVLAQKTEADAVTFLNAIKHASGQNYIFGGPDQAYSWECSANTVAKFTPPGSNGAVWHTNHPLANQDYTNLYRENLKRRRSDAPIGGSATRMLCLENRLAKIADPDVAAIKEILASQDSPEHPVCRPKEKGDAFTFAATIMILGKEPELHWSPGPPHITPYQTLRFKPATK